jgi:hypothetical protein
MIEYPMSNRDAMRSVMVRVPAAEVRFVDPVLQQFFDDESAGLCTVEVKRLAPTVMPRDVQHLVHVRYDDPEIEMIRRLSI